MHDSYTKDICWITKNILCLIKLECKVAERVGLCCCSPTNFKSAPWDLSPSLLPHTAKHSRIRKLSQILVLP